MDKYLKPPFGKPPFRLSGVLTDTVEAQFVFAFVLGGKLGSKGGRKSSCVKNQQCAYRKGKGT